MPRPVRRIATFALAAALALAVSPTVARAEAAAAGGLIGTLVTAPGATPVAGAKVYAVDNATNERVRVTTTAADGGFTLGRLAPGSYSVLFSKPQGGKFLNTWSPGTADPAQAARYQVTRGDGAIDAVLLAASRATVRVVDAQTGNPVQGADARRLKGPYVGTPGSYSDANGIIVLTGLAPGHYEYLAAVPRVGGPSPYVSKRFVFDVAEPGSQLKLKTVRLQPTG